MSSARSVEHALDLLLKFIDKPSMEASEIAATMKISRPTLYRLLGTLEKKGLLRSWGQPRAYELTPLVVELANAWLSLIDPARVGRPFLRELFDLTKETTSLYVLRDGVKRVCVQQFQSDAALSFSPGVGYTVPLYRGASGKAILAFLPEEQAAKALRAAPRDVDRAVLRRVLSRVRRDRYYVSEGELVDGVSSVAAPIFGHGGAVAAAVVVSAPDARFTARKRERFIVLVRATAEKISAALGGSVTFTGVA